MEKKFDADSWQERCKTCVYAKFSKSYHTVICTKKGSCEYIKKNGSLTYEYEDKEEKIKKSKKGKICPICGMFKLYQDMSASKKINGKYYYTYCKECRRLAERLRKRDSKK